MLVETGEVQEEKGIFEAKEDVKEVEEGEQSIADLTEQAKKQISSANSKGKKDKKPAQVSHVATEEENTSTADIKAVDFQISTEDDKKEGLSQKDAVKKEQTIVAAEAAAALASDAVLKTTGGEAKAKDKTATAENKVEEKVAEKKEAQVEKPADKTAKVEEAKKEGEEPKIVTVEELNKKPAPKAASGATALNMG